MNWGDVFGGLKNRFRSEQGGNVLMIAGASLPVLIGGAGLAVDTIQWTLWKRELQRAADSGAIAGAFALTQSSDAKATALADISKNFSRPLTFPAEIQTPPMVGAFANVDGHVRVRLRYSQRLPFSGFFLSEPPLLEAVGTAALSKIGENCMLALENGQTTGVEFGGAVVNMGCGVASNARGNASVAAKGNKVNINASPVMAVGQIDKSKGTWAPNTEYIPNAAAQPDPFSKLPKPAKCNGTAEVKSTGNGTFNVTPGCYKNFSVQGGTVNLSPGVYIIDGSLNLNGGKITGNGVTFIANGDVKTNGNADIRLTAPQSGTYKGVLIHGSTNSTIKINGTSDGWYRGAFYFPEANIELTGSANNNSQCLILVGRTLTFSGNATINNNCGPNSGGYPFDAVAVKLVE